MYEKLSGKGASAGEAHRLPNWNSNFLKFISGGGTLAHTHTHTHTHTGRQATQCKARQRDDSHNGYAAVGELRE